MTLPEIILLGRVSVTLSRPAIVLLFGSVVRLSVFKHRGLYAERVFVITVVDFTCTKASLLNFFPPAISFALRKDNLSATPVFQVPLIYIVPCGTTEWMRLEGVSVEQLVQLLCSKHGQLEQIA